jgi:hypothetical protein
MSRKRYATNPSLFTLKHVVSVGTDWELMFDSLRKCLTDANVPEAIDAIGTTQL